MHRWIMHNKTSNVRLKSKYKVSCDFRIIFAFSVHMHDTALIIFQGCRNLDNDVSRYLCIFSEVDGNFLYWSVRLLFELLSSKCKIINIKKKIQ